VTNSPDGNLNRELHVTTVNPYQYNPNNTTSLIADPTVTTWENVTYADNYFYDSNGSPRYQQLTSADWNVKLNDVAQLTQDADKTLQSWYAGTADLSKGQDAFRRLGDLDAAKLSESAKWYTPDHIDAEFPSDATKGLAPWEGIGTGWFYSAIGGGREQRPYSDSGKKAKQDIGNFKDYLNDKRKKVSFDNTITSTSDARIGTRMYGDYAVPTLFNGDFDAITFDDGNRQDIPGWSFYATGSGANQVTKQTTLRKWGTITGLRNPANYPDNYALELSSDQSIVHNRFVVPDWGALRFDLHTGNIMQGNSRGQFKVYLDEVDATPSRNPLQIINLENAVGNAGEYAADRWRIGYGKTGFETFNIDLPDVLRGKVATLRFELEGSGTVYLDNVFFKSQHLMLGNPTSARKPDNANSYNNNYLLEKPQYAVSFDANSHLPNWSAWQVNQSWTGSNRPPDEFLRDPIVESLGWVSAKNNDYKRPLSDIVPGPTLPNGSTYKLAPGHLAPNAERGRNFKDAVSTFLTSNIVPQHGTHNNSIWKALEGFTRNLATRQSREVYLYAGGVGEKNPSIDKAAITVNNDPSYGSYNLPVPSHLWKVFLILDTPGIGLQQITPDNAQAFAVWTENTLPSPGRSPYTRWNENGMEIINISELERRLNRDANNQILGVQYSFFSNLSDSVRQILKTRPVNIPSGRNPHQAFLLAESPLPTDKSVTISTDTSIRHNSVTEYSPLEPRFFINLCSTQVASGEVDCAHTSSLEMGGNQARITQIGSIQNSVTQVSSRQIDPTEISSIQSNLPKISFPKAGIAEIDFIQNHFGDNSIIQVNTTQFGSSQFIRPLNIGVTEISFPVGIPLQQLVSSNFPDHYLPSSLTNTFKDNPLNLTLEITDLPTGQLAEAVVTHYTDQGIPNGGKILIDHNANGLGWFIDPTPFDHSEFSQTLTDTALLAAADSEAYGKYDLLTTILHEIGHLAGFIYGYNEFDRHIQNINGKKTFVADNFTATLSPDGSHLDSTAHPYDLMNTTLRPGVRKLPSLLNLQILNTLRSEGVREGVSEGELIAPLTSAPLLGINNGTFDTQDIWSTRGAANIIEGQAVLTDEAR
ncbi:MAG: DNA/RNA non-specific endonuclease, partial [Rivularia sp. (in: cyanobacteria)]